MNQNTSLNPISALLITNPNSRMGAEADIEAGIALLESVGIRVIKAESKQKGDVARFIEQYHSQIQLVIVGGGDGTINSAAKPLYQYQLPLAILPLGTANDLARSLNLPLDLPSAFKVIAENNQRNIDLGVVNGRYFFNAAHIGLGVQVTHELTPEVKKRWGVFSYLKAVFAAFKNNRAFRATINIDGQAYRMHSIHLAIGNGRYYGGGNIIDEEASIDEGMLNIYSLHPQSLWELLGVARLLRHGKQRLTEKAFNTAGKRIEITTRPALEIHADGEPISHTPVVFEIIQGALRVVCSGPVSSAESTASSS